MASEAKAKHTTKRNQDKRQTTISNTISKMHFNVFVKTFIILSAPIITLSGTCYTFAHFCYSATMKPLLVLLFCKRFHCYNPQLNDCIIQI